MKNLAFLAIVGLSCFGLVGCGGASENSVITTDAPPQGAVSTEAQKSQYEKEMMEAQQRQGN